MGFFDAIGDAVSSAAHAVGGAIEDAAGAVAGAAEDVAGAIGGAAKDVAGAVETAATDTFSVISTAADWTVHAADTAVNAVEDAAEETGSAIKKAATYVGHQVADAAKGVWQGVEDVAGGVAGAVGDVFSGVTQGVGGFVDNLVHGRVADAFGSLAQGLDKAFLQAPLHLFNGVVDGAQDALDGASHLLGPLSGPINEVVDRAADIVRTVGTTADEIVRDGYHQITDTAIGVMNDLGKVGGDLIHGNFGDAAKDFGLTFVHAGENFIAAPFDTVVRTLQGAASIVQTATGLEPPARKLTSDERAMLEKVYGDSIDYDSIRIKMGGALNDKMAPHTVGNTIYMSTTNGSQTLIGPDGKLTADGLTTLVHETCHVWQSENGGGKYIAESLSGQGLAEAQGKDRNEDYNWQSKFPGTDFSQLNPEEQAHFIEQVVGPALLMPGNFDDNVRTILQKLGAPADSAAVAYADNALSDLRNRVGVA